MANQRMLINSEKLRYSEEYFTLMNVIGQLSDYSVLVMSLDVNLLKADEEEMGHLTRIRQAIKQESESQQSQDDFQDKHIQARLEDLASEKD